MNMLWWIFCGAAGLWIGMPNPVASFPAAALLYPASLFLLGTGSTSWKHAFRLGWLCGLAGASACLYWLAIPVHDFGGLPWALAAPCPLLMGAYIGLYGGLFAALAHALRGEQAWRKGVALGLGWYLMECFRGWFFTGFPWITLASAFTPWTPVIQLASVIGAYGSAACWLACPAFVRKGFSVCGTLMRFGSAGFRPLAVPLQVSFWLLPSACFPSLLRLPAKEGCGYPWSRATLIRT